MARTLDALSRHISSAMGYGTWIRFVDANTARIAPSGLDGNGRCLVSDGTDLDVCVITADIDVDPSTSGAGGLDTGSLTANTTLCLYLITKDDGADPDGILSLSESAPTMPAGYTHRSDVLRRIYIDDSSEILEFVDAPAWADGYVQPVTRRIVDKGSYFWTLSDEVYTASATIEYAELLNYLAEGYTQMSWSISFRTEGTEVAGASLLTRFATMTPWDAVNAWTLDLEGMNSWQREDDPTWYTLANIAETPTKGREHITVEQYYDGAESYINMHAIALRLK